MFCSNCGEKVQGQFCSKCGSPPNGEKSNDLGLVFQQTRNIVPAKPGAPTSGTAIAAIVLTFFIPLVGLILGLVAKNEIKNSNGEKSGDGLAAAAIILSLVFMVIYAVVIIAWIGLLGTSMY
jgi:hypothetical protein